MEDVLKQKLALLMFNKQFDEEYFFLKPKQIDCLKAIQEKDTVAILPTGYGKSLIFELLPHFSKCVCDIKSIVIIIAPLNAIIEQELSKLGSYVCQVSKTEPVKFTGITHFIGHPEDILFHAESLGRIGKTVDKVFVVVDESHCILDWGEDFRPDFRLICELRPHLPKGMKMLAITATASKHSQKEIASLLGMKDYNELNTTPVLNDNVKLTVQERIPSTGGCNTVQEAYNFVFKPLLLQLYSEEEDFPLTVVYCKLQWCGYAIELAKRLLGPVYRSSCANARVVQYHAQQPHDLNTSIVNTLSKSDSPIRLVFATIALGMGCDLRHIKRIIHAGPPSSLEVYTQEVGRAGRDGSKAEAILCYNGTDLAQRHVDRSVKEYCKERKSCRRAFISSYFDSTVSVPDQDCCDVCDTSNSCSQVLKSRDDLKIPTLTKRQQLFDILNAYRLSDMSGVCQNHLNEHVIHIITDTFEYVETVEQMSKYFKQPENIAQSVHAIKSHVLSML